ncbi:hypothetical protein QD460_22115 [Rhizobium jaguaris]
MFELKFSPMRPLLVTILCSAYKPGTNKTREDIHRRCGDALFGGCDENLPNYGWNARFCRSRQPILDGT